MMDTETYRDRERKHTARVTARLSIPIPASLPEQPIGLCSSERAQYLMGAPGLEGGAIFVRYDAGGLGHGLLAIGEMAVERPLDRAVVIAHLRSQLERWGKHLTLEEPVGEVMEILDIVEGQELSA